MFVKKYPDMIGILSMINGFGYLCAMLSKCDNIYGSAGVYIVIDTSSAINMASVSSQGTANFPELKRLRHCPNQSSSIIPSSNSPSMERFILRILLQKILYSTLRRRQNFLPGVLALPIRARREQTRYVVDISWDEKACPD